jgi:hypothetical protein
MSAPGDRRAETASPPPDSADGGPVVEVAGENDQAEACLRPGAAAIAARQPALPLVWKLIRQGVPPERAAAIVGGLGGLVTRARPEYMTPRALLDEWRVDYCIDLAYDAGTGKWYGELRSHSSQYGGPERRELTERQITSSLNSHMTVFDIILQPHASYDELIELLKREVSR